MYGADIAQSHNAGELAGTLYGYVIVKHFYLNVRPFNAVISMLCEVICYVKKVLVSPKTRAFFFL